jgi:hypothetical protein
MLIEEALPRGACQRALLVQDSISHPSCKGRVQFHLLRCVFALCTWRRLLHIWGAAVCSQLLGVLRPLLADMRGGVHDIVHPCGPGLHTLIFFVLHALCEILFTKALPT